MNGSQLELLLRLVARTEDDELSCSVCFDLLARFVDLELAGGDPGPRLSVFRQHLEQCAVCREEYEVVSELARLEADGRS